MEPQNILADDVNIGGPVFFIQITLFVTAIAERGDIVCKRVKPYIDGVALAYGNGNTPLDFGSGYAQILKSRF